MSNTRKADPTYYETHCFGDEFADAMLNGELIITGTGENTVEAIRRHMMERREPAAVVEAGK